LGSILWETDDILVEEDMIDRLQFTWQFDYWAEEGAWE
jgi:hypothetical protein